MEPGAQTQVWSRIRVQAKRYISMLSRFWWLLPLTVSFGLCIAAWWVSQMPPAFMSMARMMISGHMQTQQSASYSEEQNDFNGTQIELMRSNEVQQRAVARVQTLHPELPVEPIDYAVSLLPHSTIFELTVTARDPVYAQTYLDAVMDEYINKKRELRRDASDESSDGIAKVMTKLRKDMEVDDAAILDFEKKNNIGYLQEEGNSAAKYLTQLNQQLSDLTTEYNLLQLLDLDQNLDRQNGSSTPATPTTGDATTQGADSADTKANNALTSYGPIASYQQARQNLALLKSQLADMSTRLKPKHTKIIDLNNQIQDEENVIATLKVQSNEALKTHHDAIGLQIQNLKSVIADKQAQALVQSGFLSEFEKLKTKAASDQTQYNQLLNNMQGVSVASGTGDDAVQVTERASESISVKPGLAKIFLTGIGGGLLVGLLIIFILDQLDDRISSLMELQTYFPEHLLGQIPKDKMTGDAALLQPGDDRQALIESFRTLRSSIIFLPVEGKRPKTIVITSALPDEGKTTVVSNLAITLAFSGAKTLIVDADMRSGKLSHLFGADQTVGLSSILSQKASWSDAVSMTWIDNLYLLPAGPSLHHTSEHLLGKVTDQFLRDIYDQFDYVLFDSPPVLILDDSLSLAPKIDATIFIVRFNQSSIRSSRRAVELLHRRQANIIGLVCNGVTLSETEYNYNYSYGKYGSKYNEVKLVPEADKKNPEKVKT